MRRYEVIITPFAAANIREAHAWLTARNPEHADRWLAAIREEILGLETLPEAHPVAAESAAFDAEIRQLLVGRGTPWKVSSRSRSRRSTYCISGTALAMPGVRDGAA